MLSKENIE